MELEGREEGGEGGHVGARGLELEGGRGWRSLVARKVDLEGGTTDVIGSGRSRPAKGGEDRGDGEWENWSIGGRRGRRCVEHGERAFTMYSTPFNIV